MIIDSHQHFWAYNPIRDTWINETMKVIRTDFFPSDLKTLLEQNNVDGCIAVQADQSEEETEFLLQCAGKNNFIKGVVGWVDLLEDTLEERLEYFSRNKLFKGVRHIVQAEPDPDFMLREDFQKGIACLSKFGLTYDILVHPYQLTAAIQLVKKFPLQRFVLDHMAKPQISEGLDSQWKDNVTTLAKCPNVYCKLSGMVTETKNFLWREEDFKPFIDVILIAFGVDRVLFGSDWPVCLPAASYSQVMEICKSYFSQFQKADKDKFFGDNAIKAYRLEI